MKVSDIIKDLQEGIRDNGDTYVRSFSISTEDETYGRSMRSPTRKNKDGDRLIMTHKEFSEWVKTQKDKTV